MIKASKGYLKIVYAGVYDFRRIATKASILIMIFLGGLAMANEDAEKVLLESIGTLSETKALTENRVRLLNSLLADGDVTADDLRPLKETYRDARARVNASFDRLLVELEVLDKDVGDGSLEELAGAAEEELKAFIAASDDVIFGEDRSGIGAAAVGAAPGFFGAIVEIWKTLRGEKRAQRAALVARIEDMKWVAFDELR